MLSFEEKEAEACVLRSSVGFPRAVNGEPGNTGYFPQRQEL